jgi:nucleoside permease NupC
MTQSELFTIMASGWRTFGAVMAAYVKIAGVEINIC